MINQMGVEENKFARGKNIIEVGDKFEYMLVVGIEYDREKRQYKYNCECDCGEMRTVPRGSLVYGRTKSCGCMRAKLKQATIDRRYDLWREVQSSYVVNDRIRWRGAKCGIAGSGG